MDVLRKRPILLYLLIFLILLPVALNINYWQNDDWVYYPNVERFLKGDFSLDPYIAATFYSTGFLAAGFALLFGIIRIPVLTLFVSVSSIYLAYLILRQRCKIGGLDSVLLSMLLLVNPLFMFTTWGFMTDNYFLFFMLLSLYFMSYKELVSDRLTKKGTIYLVLGNVVAVVAYLSRQLGLILPLSLGLWLLYNRRYKRAFIQFLFFVALAAYHYFVFPTSDESLETKFVFSNLTYFRYVISFGTVLVTYLALFLLPLYLPNKLKDVRMTQKALLFMFVLGVLFVLSEVLFKNIGWLGEKLYYLKYTVQQNGFFVENLHGPKNDAWIPYGLYGSVDIIAKIAGFGAISYLLVYKKLKGLINLHFIVLIIYAGSLLIVEKVYDRYLIPLFPLVILSTTEIFIKGELLPKYKRAVLILFIAVVGYYSYNFTADYFLTNNYVWNKSLEISRLPGVEKNNIVATDAWRYLYPTADVLYKFTYDSPEKQDYAVNWRLVDSYNVNYPLRFLHNRVYLYAKLNSVL